MCRETGVAVDRLHSQAASSESAQKGRKECSHGWSAAGTPASATRGSRPPHQESPPEGAKEADGAKGTNASHGSFAPSGLLLWGVRRSTGSACRGTGCASPVATARGPSGADLSPSRLPSHLLLLMVIALVAP